MVVEEQASVGELGYRKGTWRWKEQAHSGTTLSTTVNHPALGSVKFLSEGAQAIRSRHCYDMDITENEPG